MLGTFLAMRISKESDALRRREKCGKKAKRTGEIG
jgi:hypothetical protein